MRQTAPHLPQTAAQCPAKRHAKRPAIFGPADVVPDHATGGLVQFPQLLPDRLRTAQRPIEHRRELFQSVNHLFCEPSCIPQGACRQADAGERHAVQRLTRERHTASACRSPTYDGSQGFLLQGQPPRRLLLRSQYPPRRRPISPRFVKKAAHYRRRASRVALKRFIAAVRQSPPFWFVRCSQGRADEPLRIARAFETIRNNRNDPTKEEDNK